MPDSFDIGGALEGATLGSLLLDWAQTRQIARNPQGPDNPDGYYEKNTFLGDHPSQGKVDAWMAASLPVHHLVREVLPDKLQMPYDLATLAYEAKLINDNRKIGLGINKGALGAGVLLMYLMGKNRNVLNVNMLDGERGAVPGLRFDMKF